MAKGEGVHNVYKDRARAGGDVLWHVTIRGQKELAEGIPLHMSLKVFEDKKDMDLEEIKRKVKEFDIHTPDPKRLTFKTTIFTSQIDGNKYYMLLIEGVDKAYREFYESLKHCGTVYKNFMPHVTIDKDLYESINKKPLKPEEIKFSHLTAERGAGNTIFEFKDLVKAEELKQTLFLCSELKHHRKAISLNEECLRNYFQDNPELKDILLKKHEERITAHFGNDRDLLEMAWKEGIEKAHKLLSTRK